MKSGKFNGLALTAAFVAGILISAYFLLQLKSDLAMESGVLSTSEVPIASSYILRIQIAVFSTFTLGLFGFYFIQRHHQRELVYIEKTRNEQKNKQQEDSEQTSKTTSQQKDELIQLLKKEKEKPVEKAFHLICKQYDAVAGALYESSGKKEKKFELTVPFALSYSQSERPAYELGEGFVGQAAKEKKTLYIDNIPENIQHAASGLGHAPPKFLSVIPLMSKEEVIGVCELGTFRPLAENEKSILADSCQAIAEFIKPANGTKKEKIANHE